MRRRKTNSKEEKSSSNGNNMNTNGIQGQYDTKYTPLLESQSKRRVTLYEPDVLDMDKSIALGFLVLMTGGASDEKKDSSADDHVDLAFISLTDGNVIDACLGNDKKGTLGGTMYSNKQARATKEFLRDAAEKSTNKDFEKLAVRSYENCFRVVLKHNEKISKQSFFIRCWKCRKTRKKSESELVGCFSELYDALGNFS